MRCSGAAVELLLPTPLCCPMRIPTVLLRWHAAATLTLIAALFTGCSTFDEQQRKWIFQAPLAPSSTLTSSSSPRGDGMDDVWIEHDSQISGRRVTLHALWKPSAQPAAPVLLYLHGARRDVSASTHRIHNMNALGFSVLAIDYRGFGRSTNELPSERTAAEDALAAWEWLTRRFPDRDRYVFGHSLGGAIAIDLAATVDDEKGLMVEGTFSSIPDVFRTFRWGWLPITALITQRFESVDKIGKVGSPVLVVHGSDDSLIRPELALKLYERAPEPKRFVLVEGGTHHSTNSIGQDLYRDALREMFGLGV